MTWFSVVFKPEGSNRRYRVITYSFNYCFHFIWNFGYIIFFNLFLWFYSRSIKSLKFQCNNAIFSLKIISCWMIFKDFFHGNFFIAAVFPKLNRFFLFCLCHRRKKRCKQEEKKFVYQNTLIRTFHTSFFTTR